MYDKAFFQQKKYKTSVSCLVNLVRSWFWSTYIPLIYIQNCSETQQVILGDMDGETENVYFIRRGKCEIVRRILVVRHQSPYQRPNILLPKMAKRRSEFLNKPYCKDRRIDREEIRFLTVTSLLPGNYFGVGKYLYPFLTITSLTSTIFPFGWYCRWHFCLM